MNKTNTQTNASAAMTAQGAYYILENGTWFQASGNESMVGLRRLSEDEADRLLEALLEGDKKVRKTNRRVNALCRKYGEADKIGESIFGHK